MMRLLDEADEECRAVGATNTVVNNDGYLKGYNTDVWGFLDPVRKRNIDCSGMDVLIVGAGGAARAIVAGLAKEKAGRITIANRTAERAESLAKFAEN